MNIRRWLLVLLCGISTVACDNYLDINDTPNNPTEVPPNLVFAAGQVRGAYELYGPINLNSSLWVQHWATTGAQYRQQDQYNVATNTYNNQWIALYPGTLKDLQYVVEQGEELELPNYAAPARIMRAYFFLVSTEMWGDVPYSEALIGTEALEPKYDSQQSIYADIISQLDQALAEIDESDDAIFYVGTEDVMYSGDMTLWRKFANTLKLKIAMRMTNADPTQAQDRVVGILSGGVPLLEAGEDGEVAFINAVQNRNPQWEQNNTRPSDFGPSNTLLTLMQSMDDPRIPIYFDFPVTTPDSMVGADNGLETDQLLPSVNDYSRLGSAYKAATAPSVLLTHFERLFLEAEAAIRGWHNSGEAEQLYNDAITAAFDKHQVELGTYLDAGSPAAFPANGSEEDQLNALYTQKYIALFSMGLEAYSEWRRTGIPELSPAQNDANNGVIPTRYPYVDQEYANNPKNTPPVTISDKLWFAK